MNGISRTVALFAFIEASCLLVFVYIRLPDLNPIQNIYVYIYFKNRCIFNMCVLKFTTIYIVDMKIRLLLFKL